MLPFLASQPHQYLASLLLRTNAQVIAGPGRNPGAVAVEDERGRVVLLGKSRKVGGCWPHFSTG